MSGMVADRRTIDASDNPAVLNAMRTRNNGRYNGNGREWGTPPELFAALDAEFHFTLDACASSENAKVARYFTEADNGLEQDWGTERVFMNPPYGREIYAWTKKAREASERGALVVGLLPASTDLAWWHEDVQGHAEYRFLRGRVRFITGGRLNASGFFASVVVIWRPTFGLGCVRGCRTEVHTAGYNPSHTKTTHALACPKRPEL
jgi:phage N-6-adenine-methyltransferase